MKDRTTKVFLMKGINNHMKWQSILQGSELSVKGREFMKKGNQVVPHTFLCERMLSPENIEEAVRRVKANKGSAGIDGMTIYELDAFMQTRWEIIKGQILSWKYKPQPVRRVEIPKENGGVRLLGVPCVIDRVIQQAMVQVLQSLCEPHFSEFSYGFRPKRSAEDALRKTQEYMAEGYKYVVDLDLSKFFDTIDHEFMMNRVREIIEDKDIKRLIYLYLKSGVMTNGSFLATEKGTPQGGPLSPLLSNIYLTKFDKELEKRVVKFVRYADDCQIFTKSKYSCKRVMRSTIAYLENKMKLKVNMEKTEARRAKGSSFLGVTFISCGKDGKKGMCHPKDKKKEKFKQRVKEITKRSRGISFENLIKELNAYLRGWINYFARTNMTKWLTKEIAPWINRRLRQYLWKQWKTADRRKRMLKQTVHKNCVWKLKQFYAYTSNRYWYLSGNVLGPLISNESLHNMFGLIDIEKYYMDAHHSRMKMDEHKRHVQLMLDFS